MVKCISLLPLSLLYILADILAFLARDVVRYRRKVVEDNVRTALPELSRGEQNRTVRRFYNFLADYFVETIKMQGFSALEMNRHMLYEGMEQLDEAFSQGKSVILYLGHYCNWEWVTSIPLHTGADVQMAQIYHRLSNPVADKVFLWMRSRWGSESVEMRDTLRALIGWRREGRKTCTGFIADQTPTYDSIHLFLDFLHHDTPVFTGGEKIARKLGAAVFYLDIRREERGVYAGRFIKISDDASKEEEYAVTRAYYRELERSIRRQPELWLWSHRRWKRTREGLAAWRAGRTT